MMRWREKVFLFMRSRFWGFLLGGVKMLGYREYMCGFVNVRF